MPALEAWVPPTMSAAMTAADTHRAILAVWRIEQPWLITSLARMLRDVPLAEDLTQEALLAALERWPATGVPEKPGAWLMATAKRRALDHLRRVRMLERKHEMVALELEAEQQAMPDLDSALDDDIGDEMLRLIFTACHPCLSREARAALALRMICGLTTEEIARAFLLPDATIAQRIVRAKRTLSESGLAYETPRGEELSENSPRCLRSSTSFSMKATPRRAVRTGCVPNSAMRRFAWAACSPPSRRTSPKPMDCSP